MMNGMFKREKPGSPPSADLLRAAGAMPSAEEPPPATAAGPAEAAAAEEAAAEEDGSAMVYDVGGAVARST